MTRYKQIKRVLKATNQWLSILPEREKKIVEMRLGMSVYNPKTLNECSLENEITIEGVRQAEQRASKKLEEFQGIDELLKYGN